MIHPLAPWSRRSAAGFFLGLTLTLVLVAPAAPPTYSNPVLAGDFPDPSVIRVGEEYWATATTSEWGPLFPLLHSRDLVHWDQVGNVFRQRPAWATGNFWAPEISEYQGRFYIYYVGRRAGGPLSIAVATADHPRGPWIDQGPLVGQPAGSIDADTVVDEHGDRYLIWKEDGNSRRLPTLLWAQKLSADGTRLVGEMKELARNDAGWEGNVVEGPFLKRHGDYFYMFYAGNRCCGSDCNYAVGVARSRTLLGPWEKNPGNPIVAANDTWRCPGHGSVVSTPDGRDFFLYHAYHAQTSIYVGRQGLMDEVQWNAGGWPAINGGRGPSTNAPAPLPLQPASDQDRFLDEFQSGEINPAWQWPVDNEPRFTVDARRRGRLRLAPRPDHARDKAGAVLGLRVRNGDYTATTSIDLRDAKPGAHAGISAFGDRANALGLSVVDHKLILWRRQKNQEETVAASAAGAAASRDSIQLQLTATNGHRFRFAYRTDGVTWRKIGPDIDLEGGYLPPWDRGIRIALIAGGSEDAAAAFDWVRVETVSGNR